MTTAGPNTPPLPARADGEGGGEDLGHGDEQEQGHGAFAPEGTLKHPEARRKCIGHEETDGADDEGRRSSA